MAVVAHAQEHEVKTVVALLAPTEDLAQLGFVSGVGVVVVGVNRMHLRLGDVRVIADDLANLPIVRLLVVEGNAALVDDPEMSAAPRHFAVRGVDHHALVQRHRRRAAREREVKISERAHARFRLTEDVEADGIERLIGVLG